MFQTCFECGRRGEVLQSHPLPISPLLQTPECKGQECPPEMRTRKFVFMLLSSSLIVVQFKVFLSWSIVFLKANSRGVEMHFEVFEFFPWNRKGVITKRVFAKWNNL